MNVDKIETRFVLPDPECFNIIVHVSDICRHDTFLLADELECIGDVVQANWFSKHGTIEIDPDEAYVNSPMPDLYETVLNAIDRVLQNDGTRSNRAPAQA